MSTKSSSLARERYQATSEERKVLALEMIADQLRVITEILIAKGGGRSPSVSTQTPTTAGDSRAGDSWENEGGPERSAK
jgi:hypothetical protein